MGSESGRRISRCVFVFFFSLLILILILIVILIAILIYYFMDLYLDPIDLIDLASFFYLFNCLYHATNTQGTRQQTTQTPRPRYNRAQQNPRPRRPRQGSRRFTKSSQQRPYYYCCWNSTISKGKGNGRRWHG